MNKVIKIKEKDKATLLVATYEANVEWDLEALGIDTNEIEEYYIKWGVLNITFKNGDYKTYDANVGCNGDEVDWKWSTHETFYNADWNEVELDI